VHRLKLMIALICTMTLTGGCTQWSEFGQGGAAEDFPASVFIDPESEDGQVMRELRQDFDYSRQYLDVLILRGAQRCFPASVYTASLKENRVARELGGGLIDDAEVSLLNLRLDLQQLEQKLDATTDADSCWVNNGGSAPQAAQQGAETMVKVMPADETQPSSFDLIHLSALLNSDNQFAHGSYQINPKYEENLVEACSKLQQMPEIGLRVTGHADASGDSAQNTLLSSMRAMTVVSLLTACGTDAERISLFFEGDSKPQFSGRSPEIDMVNRRVSIELDVPGNRSLK